MTNDKNALVAEVGGIAEALNVAAFEAQGTVLTPSEALALAEGLQGVIAGGLALARQHGISEVSGMALYPSVARGEKLTAVEIIRQMLNASTDAEAFADDLRHLADEIHKSPSDCGAEALD